MIQDKEHHYFSEMEGHGEPEFSQVEFAYVAMRTLKKEVEQFIKENQMSDLQAENQKLILEVKALKEIADFASWTVHGSRIYKALPQVHVCHEFYVGISEAYRNYEKEFKEL